MAIIKRTGKQGAKYQVKVKGFDGMWITDTFDRKADAEAHEAKLLFQKKSGFAISNVANQITVDEFFRRWNEHTQNGNVSAGWRRDQLRNYDVYVKKFLGRLRVQSVTPANVSQVLVNMTNMNRAPQTRLHVYNLMHKVFKDAVETFEILNRNPVKRSLKPVVPTKEAAYLNTEDVKRLLIAVRGSPYEAAIWLGVFAGLRVGEVQALKWESMDLNPERPILHVRSTYLKKEKRFKDAPKGEKWRTVRMPIELLEVLQRQRTISKSEFVASPEEGFLKYEGYLKALKRECVKAGVRVISTHGLRHSSSEVYMDHGASRDDLRVFWQHSAASVTDRYVHDKGQRLEKVTNVIRLFPTPNQETEVSQKFPKSKEAVN